MKKPVFRQALPVWEKGKEREKNYFLRFVSIVPPRGIVRIAASSIYRVFIDGKFLYTGPARAAHGYYRVDEVEYFSEEKQTCEIKIEVGAYNCNSFEYLDEAGFLQCEIEADGKVVAATGRFGFTAVLMAEKLQKVQRYSFQRTFCEEYDYRRLPDTESVVLAAQPCKKLLSRGIPQQTFPEWTVKKVISAGTVHRDTEGTYPRFRYVENIGAKLKGFSESQVETHLLQDAASLVCTNTTNRSDDSQLISNTFQLRDVGQDITGLIVLEVTAESETDLYLLFDEILTQGDIDFTRLETTNAVRFRLIKGRYFLQTFEPYTFRYLKLISLGGNCTLHSVAIRQMVSSVAIRPQMISDPTLKRIYCAGVETFRQNAVDIFMDCPSRERAGWLCDSFFTARTEYTLTGECAIERNFLENYLLPKSFACIPPGMVPMCYPADHYDGVFIPNWAMWLVLELKEYLERSGDREMILRFKERVYELIGYLDSFLNSDGLLENLEGWVFLEWSKANELTGGVNYPSNMLYAHMLDFAGKLYADEKLQMRSWNMVQIIRQQSFDGEFFHDHAIRKDGKLTPEPECTETCQYYAFFCRIAQPEKDVSLWKKLVSEFGPKRKVTGAYPQIYFANAFIGNYLRLELLYRNHLYDQLKQEIAGYFAFMADTAGTLWEHDSPTASCCHGFASHVVYWLGRITE